MPLVLAHPAHDPNTEVSQYEGKPIQYGRQFGDALRHTHQERR